MQLMLSKSMMKDEATRLRGVRFMAWLNGGTRAFTDSLRRNS